MSPRNGHRTRTLPAQASALAALVSSRTRKKSSARPVRSATIAPRHTSSRLTTVAAGARPCRSRQTATAAPLSTAIPAPSAIERPPASHPAANPTTGTTLSSAARRPPSRSASESSPLCTVHVLHSPARPR